MQRQSGVDRGYALLAIHEVANAVGTLPGRLGDFALCAGGTPLSSSFVANAGVEVCITVLNESVERIVLEKWLRKVVEKSG